MKSNSLLAFITGAAIGAAVAVLLAPDKGSVTRRKIREMAEEEKDRLLDLVDAGKEKLLDMVDAGKEKVSDMVQAEKEMVAGAVEYGKGKIRGMVCEDHKMRK